MKIIHAITMHLDHRDTDAPVIDAVQGESGRVIALSLFEKGKPWIVPTDATVQIRYCKPDMTGGIYDSMPDGSKAWSSKDNTVTFSLPDQVLAAAGTVSMQVAVTAEEIELATFQFYIRVESDPSLGALDSEDYINIGQWLMAQILDAIERAELARDIAIRAADDAKALAAAVSSRMELCYTPVYTDPDTGEWHDSHVAICSQVFPILGNKLGVAFPKTVKVRLFYYNQNLDFVGSEGVSYDSFEISQPQGAFAVLEVRYASEMNVEDVEALARYVTVYIPNTSAQDAATAGLYALDALNYKNQAQQSAARAEEAAERAQAGAANETLTILQKDGNITYSVATYDGTQPVQVELPQGVEFFRGKLDESEPPAPYTVFDVSKPAILNGTFRVNRYKEDEFTFNSAFAYGTGDIEKQYIYVQDAQANLEYRFIFDRWSNGDYTVETAPLMGQSGGGECSVKTKIVEITTTEEVNRLIVTIDGEDAEIWNKAKRIDVLSSCLSGSPWYISMYKTVIEGSDVAKAFIGQISGYRTDLVHLLPRGSATTLIETNNNALKRTEFYERYLFDDNTESISFIMEVSGGQPVPVGTYMKVYIEGVI